MQGALANPLIPDESALASLSPDSLRAFSATNYAGPRLVLAASGVDHRTLVDLATPMLSTVSQRCSVHRGVSVIYIRRLRTACMLTRLWPLDSLSLLVRLVHECFGHFFTRHCSTRKPCNSRHICGCVRARVCVCVCAHTQVPAGPSGAASVPEPASAYRGACVSLPGGGPLSQLIVAWEYKGGWRDVEGAVAMTVLTYLMGGGDSFSSGEAHVPFVRCG